MVASQFAALERPDPAEDDVLTVDATLPAATVVVTGSQIRGAGVNDALAVSVIDAEAISDFGFESGDELLDAIPEQGQNFFNEAENISGGVNSARGDIGAFNLRNMGTGNTLVLLNGRRAGPAGVRGGVSAFDLNVLPLAAIERVEILKDGASSIYGSDAVAGVVNFILDTDFEGISGGVQYSFYQHDNSNKYMQGLMDARGFEYETGNTGFDGEAYNVEIAFGGDFADGKGNATAYVTWVKNEALLQDARDYSTCALNNAGTACGGSGNAVVPNFAIYSFDEDGNLAGGAYVGLQPDGTLGSTRVARADGIAAEVISQIGGKSWCRCVAFRRLCA